MLNQTENSIKIMLPVGIAAGAFSVSVFLSSFFGERAANVASTVSPINDLIVFALLGSILWGLIYVAASKYDYFRKGKTRIIHAIFLLFIPILVGVMSGYSSYLSWKGEQSQKLNSEIKK